ncbi:hypothetical protein, partial [Nocardia cyriacigeorgica]|uniref:hypothetical protein n=1 Tax=Nocardia cyriacigeorgica TaxID=135487 RepID=UPI0018942730
MLIAAINDCPTYQRQAGANLAREFEQHFDQALAEAVNDVARVALLREHIHPNQSPETLRNWDDIYGSLSTRFTGGHAVATGRGEWWINLWS